MVKTKLAIATLLVTIFSFPAAFAWDVSLSAYRLDDKVQDDRGDEASDPIQPALSIGHTFDMGLGWFDSVHFSPRLGYVRDLEPSRDSYGQQRIEHIYVLYDFVSPIADSTFLRYGFGSFLKRVSGDGGSLTIPNGSGTATAYRPEGTKTSSTATTNLGIDYIWSDSGSTGYRLAAELHAYQILDNKRRWLAYQLSFGAEF